MRDSDLTKLRRKRARINARLRKLEPLLTAYYERLWPVEEAIKALAPELDMPPRRYQPNRWFARSELPRLVMDIMCEAAERGLIHAVGRGNNTRRVLAAS